MISNNNRDAVFLCHFITLHHRLSCYIWEDGQIKPRISKLFVQAKTQWQCRTLTDMMLRQRSVTANTQKSAKLWTWESFCSRTYNLFYLMFARIMYLNTNANPDLYTAWATWPYSQMQMQMQMKVFQVYINAMQHWCAQSLSGLEKHRHKEKPICTGHQCDPYSGGSSNWWSIFPCVCSNNWLIGTVFTNVHACHSLIPARTKSLLRQSTSKNNFYVSDKAYLWDEQVGFD